MLPRDLKEMAPKNTNKRVRIDPDEPDTKASIEKTKLAYKAAVRAETASHADPPAFAATDLDDVVSS